MSSGLSESYCHNCGKRYDINSIRNWKGEQIKCVAEGPKIVEVKKEQLLLKEGLSGVFERNGSNPSGEDRQPVCVLPGKAQ